MTNCKYAISIDPTWINDGPGFLFCFLDYIVSALDDY